MENNANEAHELGSTLQQINDAEQRASALEKMLDEIDQKMDLILDEVNKIQETKTHSANSPDN